MIEAEPEGTIIALHGNTLVEALPSGIVRSWQRAVVKRKVVSAAWFAALDHIDRFTYGFDVLDVDDYLRDGYKLAVFSLWRNVYSRHDVPTLTRDPSDPNWHCEAGVLALLAAERAACRGALSLVHPVERTWDGYDGIYFLQDQAHAD